MNEVITDVNFSPKHMSRLIFGIILLLTTCENRCHLEITL